MRMYSHVLQKGNHSCIVILAFHYEIAWFGKYLKLNIVKKRIT